MSMFHLNDRIVKKYLSKICYFGYNITDIYMYITKLKVKYEFLCLKYYLFSNQTILLTKKNGREIIKFSKFKIEKLF